MVAGPQGGRHSCPIAWRLVLRSFIDIAIIGAGPNGLSLAAHLAARGADFRIFGKPMELWREHMPPGMRLKSDGKSSDLADSDDALTLKTFCAANGIAHDDALIPIALDTFVKYGMAFQRRFVPQLEEKLLTALEARDGGFTLRFEDGEIVRAKRVVLAVGVSHFTYLPKFLRGLPDEFVTHSSDYGALDRFRGEQVTVLGAGASAIDLAGLLKDQGSDVSVMTRRRTIEFHHPPGSRSLSNRLRAPDSGMGAGWQLWLYGKEPRTFHALPQPVRLHKARTMLGPSTGWFMRDSIVGRVPLLTGLAPHQAEVKGGKLHLRATALDGSTREIATKHLIAATGYRVDLRRLAFLSAELLARLDQVEHAPALSSRFETSVPGLYMVGFAALNDFGPLVRFVLGARYQARSLSRHLVASGARGRVAAPLPATGAAD
jgi:thioredoxin reductase